jgi:hypothetical protein
MGAREEDGERRAMSNINSKGGEERRRGKKERRETIQN